MVKRLHRTLPTLKTSQLNLKYRDNVTAHRIAILVEQSKAQASAITLTSSRTAQETNLIKEHQKEFPTHPAILQAYSPATQRCQTPPPNNPNHLSQLRKCHSNNRTNLPWSAIRIRQKYPATWIGTSRMSSRRRVRLLYSRTRHSTFLGWLGLRHTISWAIRRKGSSSIRIRLGATRVRGLLGRWVCLSSSWWIWKPST